MVRGALKPAPASEAPRMRIGGSPFMQGFVSTVLNPKVAIFFLAALPQFVGTGPDAPWQGMLLIAIVYALGFLWCALRSEEHTSELQSLLRNSYAVFCLKKKQYTKW